MLYKVQFRYLQVKYRQATVTDYMYDLNGTLTDIPITKIDFSHLKKTKSWFCNGGSYINVVWAFVLSDHGIWKSFQLWVVSERTIENKQRAWRLNFWIVFSCSDETKRQAIACWLYCTISQLSGKYCCEKWKQQLFFH